MAFYIPPYRVVRESIVFERFSMLPADFKQYSKYPNDRQWTKEQQQSFLERIIKRAYTPPVVLREVNLPIDYSILPDRKTFEVIDGWQRINTLIKFMKSSKIRLPDSREKYPPFDGFEQDVFACFPDNLRIIFEFTFSMTADIIIGIDNPNNRKHEKIAAELFSDLHFI